MHKIAFEIGGFPIHWYGVLVAAGFFAGLWTAGRRALASGIHSEVIADLGTWIIVGGVGGARLNYVINFWASEFADKPLWEVFRIRQGGLVFYGGFLGACLAVILYARLKRLPLWKLADVLAPSVALGHAFGRLGCLMTGCCYGRVCELPWAIHFPKDHETAGLGVHPTQIYESILNFALYMSLAWFYRRKKFDGQIFAAYLLGYAIVRGFVETFRGDHIIHYVSGWLTQAQLVSTMIFATGLALWWWCRRVSPLTVKAA